MIYNYFVLGLFFAMTFVFGMGVGVTIALMNVQQAHAQLYNTTIPVPISVPPLQYTPNIQPTTASTTATNTDLTAIISSIVVTAIGVLAAKVSSDKKTNSLQDIVKEVVAETLKGKEVDKELARVTYQMNPEAANKINDAPSVKLQALSEDVANFTETAAKA